MYEELIEELRRPHADCDPWTLMEQAADAIKGLSKRASEWETIAESWQKACKGLQRRMPRWIPVTERLPKDCTPVQVCYIGYHNKEIGSDMLACRYEGLWCYWDGEPCSYDPCRVEITHWMPLQKPPKEES